MPGVLDLTYTISSLLLLLQLGLKVFALVDAARRPANAFPAADKQTKQFWLIILGLALVANFFDSGLGILTILGTIAAIVYVVDARPALAEVGRGGGRNNGPYGPW